MKKKSDNKGFDGCYGSVETAETIEKWVLNLITQNFERKARAVGNIWGPAGVGKSAIIKSLSDKTINFKGKESCISIIDIPLAQIEEMGDVLGMPDSYVELKKGEERKWILKEDTVVDFYLKNGWEPTGSLPKTMYAPPAWVPREEKPGIILFDDGNRASMRILKGLMQLVQDYRTIGWEIPQGWTILFTGNPDNSMYSVSSQDAAMITRMKHITMKPDVKCWAVWAEGNKIDARGISFLLRYPEHLEKCGERTNLRTFTEFFRTLERFPTRLSEEDRKMLLIEANASLDKEVAVSFMTFLSTDMELVIEPEIILNNAESVAEKINEYARAGRHDIINVMNERLCAYLLSSNYQHKDNYIANFQKYITSDSIPSDVSQSILRRLVCGTKNTPTLVKFCQGNEKITQATRLFTKNAGIISRMK